MKSTHTNYTAPSRKSKHLNFSERQLIERWRLEKKSVAQIAKLLNRNPSTIYRELKRGTVENYRSDYSKYPVYRAERAQEDYNLNSGAGGPYLKLSMNNPLCQRLETLMSLHKLSPYAALQTAIQEGFEVNICLRTLYRYIHHFQYPIFPDKLPMKGKRRRKAQGYSHRLARHNLKGDSIEKRPIEVADRQEAGHHEMDLVVSAKGGKKALLVITERKTRFEHIIIIPDKSQRSVIKGLNKLERAYGAKRFRELFKTITCDNGSEFLDFSALEQSCINKKNRTKLYYAHPFSSFERGSNENANRLIRRFLPKKTIFDKLTQQDVHHLATWMNRCPRKLFNGKSALQMAKLEKMRFLSLLT